ncbi:uncharacterized protein LOC131853196 isoform X2 [Achroia grisella]|uniref:uncharacterized protein LOC131853196 isoform X2 n=1 Tax=Achroia grisella TaxID=688607 RepID=UPI0027D24D8A|nr:uncharacterized protein LOC131853196 isoform X2 [Achroia grisella]
MEKNEKVFTSEITRGQQKEISGLYELINIIPAKPIVSLNLSTAEKNSCEFQPRTDKYYEAKRNNKYKVKTVKDIRSLFEKDVYRYLFDDLDKQQKILLRKIRAGSSKDTNTIQLAKDIFKSGNPISRSAWQMLININPEKYSHPNQYVLYNGKYIQVNGSKGGRNKFICNYDLKRHKESFKPKVTGKKNILIKKKRLLQNSLSVKFKPGPLKLKKYLDDSYQKYHVGNTEVVNLPKPGLEVQPTYGCSVEPTISNFLNSLRDIDGFISQKWAEFAVSVLGNVEKSHAIQIDKCSVTFGLSYKYDQYRMLMRRNLDKQNNFYPQCKPISQNIIDVSDIIPDVKIVIEKILDSVEINQIQDNMYTGIDEPRCASPDGLCNAKNSLSREKYKKKYGELDRLDVTIITLPENSQQLTPQACLNSFCTLGCVCASLKSPVLFKNHCGRIDCMFECKCDFSKYKVTDNFDSDCPEYLPGLINLDNEINLKLAKEEQKFHQTVVFSGEKSILLKSRKRNWKASKKYADFYSSMCLKSDMKKEPVLCITDMKFICENIEPWCMVHNLYKCFCKGKITYNSYTMIVSQDVPIIETLDPKDKDSSDSSNISKCNQPNLSNITRSRLRSERIKNNDNTPRIIDNSVCNSNVSVCSSSSEMSYIYSTCARVNSYTGRKFSNGYYKNANYKISQLEKNDRNLSKKLRYLCNQSELQQNNKKIDNIVTASGKSATSKNVSQSSDYKKTDVLPNYIRSSIDGTINKKKLVAWLEYSYKLYKKRSEEGKINITLQAPKLNKVMLHPWEFILSRYRERKNHYLVSKQRPYRIFMAVDINHPFFLDCMNIDDIRFADLHKYPSTIKNLLTNATDLKDNFCILCGLTFCWELIGTVTKMSETNNVDGETNQDILTYDSSELLKYLDDSDNSSSHVSNSVSSDMDSLEYELVPQESTQNCNNTENFDIQNKNSTNSTEKTTPDSSKWFVMTVENDFTEIQFFNKGFFVKYESIIRAINIARKANKTVRLSSQKCTAKNSNPQFGIYAIPCTNEYCVFMGPYEPDEPLGVETIKTVFHTFTSKGTRGFWITTDKVDNFKVIDNPMSFMPNSNSINTEIIPLENSIIIEDSAENKDNGAEEASTNKTLERETDPKSYRIMKPIKIKKGQLLKSASLFNKIASQNTISDAQGASLLRTDCLVINANNTLSRTHSVLHTKLKSLNTSLVNFKTCLISTIPSTVNYQSSPVLVQKNISSLSTNDKIVTVNNAPIIKITEVFSEFNKPSEKRTIVTSDRGMLILKPEDINERLTTNIPKSQNSIHSDEEINNDITNLMAGEVSRDNNDIFIISDEEDDITSDVNDWKEVWIECQNIETVGWILGRRDSKKFLSFELPGLNFSDFYPQDVAFYKINKALSKTLHIPGHVEIEWRVVESKSELKTDNQLGLEHLKPTFVSHVVTS